MPLRYLHFYPDFPGYGGKRIDKKAKVNFKIYGAANWKTMAINILPHISKSKSNQTMRTYLENYFCSKIMQKMRQGDKFKTSFYFLEKLYMM